MFNFLDSPSLETINESISSSINIRPFEPLNLNDEDGNFYTENRINEFYQNISTMTKTNLNINKIINKKPSGRKRKRELIDGEKTHNKLDNDNILRKLNIGFLNFLIDFINTILKKLGIKNDKFEHINGEFKKQITIKTIEKWKEKTVKEFLILDINKKFKDQKINEKLFNKIFENKTNIIPILENIKSKTYIEIFNKIYYKNEKNIFYEGLELELPSTFGDFLKEKAEENCVYKQKIIELIKKHLIPNNPNIFKCEKIENSI